MRKNAQQVNRLCVCGKPTITTIKNGKTYWKNICSACYSSSYRKRNPAKCKQILKKCKAKYKASQSEFKAQLMNHIGQRVCKHCKNTDTRVLSFHHREPENKKFKISWALTHNYSLENMKIEAEKCDVLCANCHMIVHATNPKGRNWKTKRTIMEGINQFCCSHCKSDDIRVLSFHHKNPDKKEFARASAKFSSSQ